MKKITLTTVFIAGVLIIGGVYFLSQDPFSDEKKEKVYTLEQSRQIAFSWMENKCPTYVYDGQDLNLKGSRQINMGNCDDCYEFVFSFKSRHGGFGNRQGEMVTQAITPHLTTATVANGRVVHALTDNEFDELAREIRQGGQGVKRLQPREVQLFYYNINEDRDEQGNIQCSPDAVQGVERIIPNQEPIQETIELLLKGNIRNQEIEAGFESEFPHPDFRLISWNLNKDSGQLSLTFSNVPGFTNGGSCRTELLRAQIKKTAGQFKDVEEVVIQPETLFQP
jgi:hypothetical protein